MIETPSAIHQVIEKHPCTENPIYLELPKCCYAIHSNSRDLLHKLSDYFKQIVAQAPQPGMPTTDIHSIECPALELQVAWQDWKREPGKQGRKDTFVELNEGRLLRKARTGMVFIQSIEQKIALGPCLNNTNQIINFIINQYMTLLQNQGYLICHAAACTSNNGGIAIAGFSGGGKSTSMLHLMDDPRCRFVSNDRLFIKADEHGLHASGVPKLPRVNPGTLVNNKRLQGILKQEEINNFTAMPKQELWQLEQKYDVDIEHVYGEKRISSETKLNAIIILNWNLENQTPCAINQFQPTDRPDLLQALMKSSGPFYHKADGSFNPNSQALDTEAYIKVLGDTPCYEVSGQVDFAYLKQFCLDSLL